MSKTLGNFDVSLASVKEVANFIVILSEHLGDYVDWGTDKDKQQFIRSTYNTLLDLSIRQFDEREIEYLKMRQRNGLFDMRG